MRLAGLLLQLGLYRPVGSGAAWRRSPHQKSAGREREKEEKVGKK